MQLRQYQIDAINAVADSFTRNKKVLLTAPTGSGKTVIFSEIINRAHSKGNHVLLLVHRQELVSQAVDHLTGLGITPGLIAAGHTPDASAPVQVASVQTLARRLDQWSPDYFRLIIVDEAHHAVAGQWSKVIGYFKDCKVLGLTASPERLDGKGLIEAFNDLIVGPTAHWLTEEGYLARARVFCPPVSADTSQRMRTRMGDYDMRDAMKVYGEQKVFGDSIAHYRKHIFPGTAICFCCSVQHAEDVAQAFNSEGIKASSLDGKMSMAERKGILANLAKGEIKVVTSCMIISEGTDIPSVGGCILLRPTQSLALHLQMIGRCLRPKTDNSDAIVLDHVGNVERHGFPTDHHPWSLEGKKERQKREAKAPGVRLCPECYAALPAGTPECPSCGHVFTPEVSTPDQVDGELAEITGRAPKGLRPGDPVRIGGTSAVIEKLSEMNPKHPGPFSGTWYIASKINTHDEVLIMRDKYDALSHAKNPNKLGLLVERFRPFRVKSRWLCPDDDARKVRPSSGAQTLEDLEEIGRRRGYKPGWARRVYAARMGVRG
jgi:DNA repair protein RadD